MKPERRGRPVAWIAGAGGLCLIVGILPPILFSLGAYVVGLGVILLCAAGILALAVHLHGLPRSRKPPPRPPSG